MQDTAVFNSSPLINLSKAGKLNLLSRLFKSVFIPEAVYKELIIEGKNKIGCNEIEQLIEKKIIHVRKVKNKILLKTLQSEIDEGEAEAIVLSIELKDCVLVIDESEGRRFAELYNVKKTGFIGILLYAHKNGLIPDFEKSLNLAINKGFWINRNLLKHILNKLKSSHKLL